MPESVSSTAPAAGTSPSANKPQRAWLILLMIMVGLLVVFGLFQALVFFSALRDLNRPGEPLADLSEAGVAFLDAQTAAMPLSFWGVEGQDIQKISLARLPIAGKGILPLTRLAGGEVGYFLVADDSGSGLSDDRYQTLSSLWFLTPAGSGKPIVEFLREDEAGYHFIEGAALNERTSQVAYLLLHQGVKVRESDSRTYELFISDLSGGQMAFELQDILGSEFVAALDTGVNLLGWVSDTKILFSSSIAGETTYIIYDTEAKTIERRQIDGLSVLPDPARQQVIFLQKKVTGPYLGDIGSDGCVYALPTAGFSTIEPMQLPGSCVTTAKLTLTSLSPDQTLLLYQDLVTKDYWVYSFTKQQTQSIGTLDGEPVWGVNGDRLFTETTKNIDCNEDFAPTCFLQFDDGAYQEITVYEHILDQEGRTAVYSYSDY